MLLMTWNIQWGRGVDGRVDLDRIVAHARRFADADVLCVQEVSDGFPALGGCDGSDQFAALADRLPGYSAVRGIGTDLPGPGARRRRFGNMLFSRWPVQQVFCHLLPWPAAPSMSMQRVAIEATLDAPLGPLRVTTTHLEYDAASQRAAQVERLRALHAEAVAHARCPRDGDANAGPFEHVPRAAASIVCGDFNFRPDAAEHQRLCAPFDDGTPAYHDAWTLAHGDTPHAHTIGLYDKVQWPGESFACDFFFVSADLAARVRDVRVDAITDASDHQPVLLELQ